MNRQDRDQFAERWLDETLARYSEAEPRDGFEGRVLASLAAHKTKRVFWRRLVWVPVASAAAIALVAGISVLRHVSRPLTTPQVVAHTPSVPVQTQLSVLATEVPTRPTRSAPNRALKVAVTRAPQPRKPQFPAPTPPTEQEDLLAAYLSATPTHELLAVAADQKQWRERVQKNAEAASRQEQAPAPGPMINYLQPSLPEGGSTESGAFGAR